MSESTEKCAHDSCQCPARADSDFCGEYCLRAENDPETGCLCGHPLCQAAHGPFGLSSGIRHAQPVMEQD